MHAPGVRAAAVLGTRPVSPRVPWAPVPSQVPVTAGVQESALWDCGTPPQGWAGLPRCPVEVWWGLGGPWRLPHSPRAPEPGHLLLQGLVLFLQPGHLVGCKRHCLVKDVARGCGAGRGVLPALGKPLSLSCPGAPKPSLSEGCGCEGSASPGAVESDRTPHRELVPGMSHHWAGPAGLHCGEKGVEALGGQGHTSPGG